jgi:tetratricopeptide (TPR) repeat protein
MTAFFQRSGAGWGAALACAILSAAPGANGQVTATAPATPIPASPNAAASPNTTQSEIRFAPAPSWVVPVALPSAPQPSPGDASAAPVFLLLHDQQTSLREGAQTTYSEVALRIQTPAGLAAGNLSIPWRPDTDVVTVHKVIIRRGAQTIDVLGAGQTFTIIRREQNLEMAMLDGVLTANIQPEGLQVGDVLNVAYSVTTHDPVLGNHVEIAGAAWNVMPIARAHMSVAWPDSLHIITRAATGLPSPQQTHARGQTRAEIAINDVRPTPPPRGAPQRFATGRIAEFTSFQNWSDLAALMAPLYARASQLPADGPLRSEVERIRSASPDAAARAQAALTLVQDRIRYVALAMGEGGLVPADAQTTWSRRFGDCKGKTALLLAILHALDIQSEPVLVSTIFGDGLDQHLPMIGLFNHVLVRATINGRTYWLDGTRSGDTRLDDIQTPNLSWGLPVIAQGAGLVRMQPSPLAAPSQSTNVRIDASGGILAPAPIHVELVVRGDMAVASNMAFASVAGEVRDNALKQYWRRRYDDVDVTTATETFDPTTREARFVMDGQMHMDWSEGSYRLDDVGVGYRADFSRDAGSNRDAPFAVAYPFYNSTHETITLPRAASTFQLAGGETISETVAGITYERHATLAGNVLTVDQSQRSVASEFSFAEAPAAQARLRALYDRTLYLSAGPYRPSHADIETQRNAAPTDFDGYIQRAAIYLDGDHADEAMADINQALSRQPHSAAALALRAIAHLLKDEEAAARADLTAAAAIEPHNTFVLRAGGMLALQSGSNAEAITQFTQALVDAPQDTFLLTARAQAYFNTRDDDRALADADAVARVGQPSPDLRLLRANVYLRRGDQAHAGAEADALARDPDAGAYGHVLAARIYANVHRQDEAMSEFDRALAIGPEAYMYVNRAGIRPETDAAGRLADADAALRLDPQMTEALEIKASVFERQHNYPDAIAQLSQAMHVAPDDAGLMARRGLAYARSGNATLAEADFANARAHANEASDLNLICWDRGVANIGLEAALSACEASLALRPDSANTLDSKGLVLLRMGRSDEAIAVYTRALTLVPRYASSLYGRGLAADRKGDHARANADFAAALAIDPDVRTRFEGYGLSAAH